MPSRMSFAYKPKHPEGNWLHIENSQLVRLCLLQTNKGPERFLWPTHQGGKFSPPARSLMEELVFVQDVVGALSRACVVLRWDLKVLAQTKRMVPQWSETFWMAQLAMTDQRTLPSAEDIEDQLEFLEQVHLFVTPAKTPKLSQNGLVQVRILYSNIISKHSSSILWKRQR